MSDDSYIDAELWEEAQALAAEEAVKPDPNADGRVATLSDYEAVRDRIYAELIERQEEEEDC